MPTVILLHGHYLGAWAWDSVRARLEGAGWRVWSGALRGAEVPWTGSLPHPAGDVSLATHVAQVHEVIRATPAPLVILGHSYGGLVLQAVLGDPLALERVGAAVFLDAALGRPGDTLLEII